MELASGKLTKITSVAIIATGISLFIAYLIYLPAPQIFAQANTANLGLILYCLATAGAAFVSWGLILARLDTVGFSRVQVLKASAVGLGLLGLMRLGTAMFPHQPFDQLIAVPISEFIVFSLLALKFYRTQ